MKASDEKVKSILQLPYSRVLRPDERGGYTAEILEFRGCFSEGNACEEAYCNLEEAAFNWVKSALEQELKIPAPFSSDGYSGRVALRLPKSLHKQAVKMAQRDGVSLNQFIVTSIATRAGSYDFLQELEQQASETFRMLANFQVLYQQKLFSQVFALTYGTGQQLEGLPLASPQPPTNQVRLQSNELHWEEIAGEPNVEAFELVGGVGGVQGEAYGEATPFLSRGCGTWLR
ncbi:type II toxin-antitoxin system HicB family antitoxin [Acidobacteria bacterium AH-259-O06]|nr:type II toxin-antitoxin system HicB family antitoxin [Acidobacteria bacterium AH-259-O06]